MPIQAGDTLVRVVMTAASGLPQDAIVNDFAFRYDGGGDPLPSEYQALFGCVEDFYNGGGGATETPAFYISDWVSRSATHYMAAYDIPTSGPTGSPVAELDWIGPSASGAPTVNLPPEVAAVLSFHGNLTGIPEEAGATRPKARRRGRIYLGPLNGAAVDENTPAARLNPGVTEALREGAIRMYDAALLLGWIWSVWSRTGDELHAVVGGWTDNAPDTQRRRGNLATERIVYTTA